MITTVYFSSQKVQYRYYCVILSKFQGPQKIFEKYTNTKFHEYSSGLSRFVPCGRTDKTKLTVDFGNFVNEHKEIIAWEEKCA
jgi:hypothetical protein